MLHALSLHLDFIIIIISAANYESPHYPVFSILLSVPPSWVQILSPAQVWARPIRLEWHQKPLGDLPSLTISALLTLTVSNFSLQPGVEWQKTSCQSRGETGLLSCRSVLTSPRKWKDRPRLSINRPTVTRPNSVCPRYQVRVLPWACLISFKANTEKHIRQTAVPSSCRTSSNPIR